MKKILFSIILTSITLFAQQQNNRPAIMPIIPFETNVISFPDSEDDYSVYYTYKIPYRLMIFERSVDSFNAEFRIQVEIKDKEDKLVARDIKDNKLTVNSFEETNDPKLILQDYIGFNLKPGDYKVSAVISDRNSSGERPLKPIDISLKQTDGAELLDPIVVRTRNKECDGKESFVLANSGGKIPFSNEEYGLIIPIADTSITELEFTMENNGEVIASGQLNNSILNRFDLAKCDDSLILAEFTDNLLTRNFLIPYVNEKIDEGVLELKIMKEEIDFEETIILNVVWFNKPISLYNSEKAIELLTYIESEDIVDSLLNEDEDDYPKVLQNYWAKFDPTPKTTFNEIMFEYYSRADYSIREFSSITNNNGANSDRGMVYIKFGKPDKVDRKSNSQGEVIEIWTYSSAQRTFSFIDKIGTGNFTLIEN